MEEYSRTKKKNTSFISLKIIVLIFVFILNIPFFKGNKYIKCSN